MAFEYMTKTPAQLSLDGGLNEWKAAYLFSQRLAHSSTRGNAGGLIFRVRDGYGSDPAAVAALTPTRGIEPRRGPTPVVSVCTCDPVYARTRFIGRSDDDWWLRSVSARGLNASLPRRVHPESIELVFYERPW